LRAAAGGAVVEPLPLLADLPESDDDSSDDDSESDSESDSEEGPTVSPHPWDRDKNAAINIRNVFLRICTTRLPPLHYQRGFKMG
jgi:hypothetical protein